MNHIRIQKVMTPYGYENTKFFGTEKISKILLKLAPPVMLA